MRLINAETLEFEEFIDPSTVRYAILSHTWATEEVSFLDMLTGNPSVRNKAGFVKIRETCRLARQKRLKYVWIDTCCIDKSSSAELSEAINSMFNWYAQSTICFAQLSELPPGMGIKTQDLAKCRWFKRGWTLQELIAPSVLELYDAIWMLRGTKWEHWQAIQEVSGISKDGFLNFKSIRGFANSSERDGRVVPVAQRMYWASRRETTRPEDMAYCLFGIFDVNMPLLYGEGGTKAFLRLQSAILEATQDLSILAWKLPAARVEDLDSTEVAHGVLAPHPSAFDHDVMRHFQSAPKVYYTGADELGFSAHMDGPLLRIKYPRISLLEGSDDQLLLFTGVEFPQFPVGRLWVPIAQLGNTYGRAHATKEPILNDTTTRGCAPLEDMALISDPSRTLSVGAQGSTLKFHDSLPQNIIIHGLDAAPSRSWNALSQVFSIPGKLPDGAGYLRIRLRRTSRNSDPLNTGADCTVTSWLNKVDIMVPWRTTKRRLYGWPETRECYVKFMLFAREYDGSPPKDWFPRIWNQGGRTHFTDEASVLKCVVDYMNVGDCYHDEGEIFVGDSRADEAVRCRVVTSTTAIQRETLDASRENPQKFELKLEVENMTWAAALEESKRRGISCKDFREGELVSVKVDWVNGHACTLK